METMLGIRARPLATLLLVLGPGACVLEDEELENDGIAEQAWITSARPGTPRGVLDGFERGRVWGWAQIVDDDEPVMVRIEVDGEPVATILADQPRADLIAKGLHPTGAAGFSTDIGPLELGSRVDGFIEDQEEGLTNGPCIVQGPLGVSSCTEGMSRGILGGYRDGRVWGWAQIVGTTEPVHVRIEVDGEPVATILANQPRRDLFDKRLHATGDAGFSAEIGELPMGAEIGAIVIEQSATLMGVPVLASPPSAPRLEPSSSGTTRR